MKKIALLSIILASLIFALSGLAQAAEDKTVMVKGEGVIFKGDRAAAKDRAVDAALRAAVEQAVGVLISSSTLVQNFVTVDDKILSQSKGYVKSWREISSKAEDNVVVVEIEATVAGAKLQGDLDEIKWVLAKKDFPRMMMLIAEQNVGESGFSYWWGNTASVISMSQVENTIIDLLAPKGFTFVDSQVLSGKIKMKDAYKVTGAGVSDKAAREIANLTDAQVVIVGTAVATDAGPVMEGSKLKSGQADISLRAINTDNGEILLTSSVHAADAHINSTTAGNKALKKAAKKVSDQMLTKLVDKWMGSSSTVIIEVAGLTGYDMFDKFKSALSHQLRGVTGVNQRKMMKDKAQLDIYFEGKTDDLAKELSAKNFDGFKLRVDEVTANRLKVTLAK